MASKHYTKIVLKVITKDAQKQVLLYNAKEAIHGLALTGWLSQVHNHGYLMQDSFMNLDKPQSVCQCIRESP